MEGTTNSDVLRLWDGCGAYDGAYYHEWSVRSFPAGSVAAYDPMKVEAPPGVTEPSSLSLQERFERVVLLCESVIEDRLSILREKDPVEREVLLTTDIDDQIGYWQWVEKELSSLK
jgi:hypothetical protein